MSYIFEIEDVTVWSPGLSVGKLYVSMCRDVARALDTEVGMTAVASDYWEIRINEFDMFVRAAYTRYFSSGHPVFKGLVGAVLAPSIVVLERGGRSIVPESAEEREFLDRARGLPMPQ